jgi:hypothetical protein
VATGVDALSTRTANKGLMCGLPIEQQLLVLIRYAALAPSSRNTQPWRFTVERNVVRLWADPGRRLPVADPDGRELYLSLGCALENLVVAAGCAGYRHEIVYFPEPAAPDLVSRIDFHPAPTPGGVRPPVPSLETVEGRCTAVRPFMAREIPSPVLNRLRAVRAEPGVRTSLCDSAERRHRSDVLSVRAVAALFGDEAYRREILGSGGAPSWMGSQPGKLTLAHGDPARRVGQQVSALVRSAPVIGVIGSMTDTPADQVRSGRMLERLWLAATAEGVALQPVSFALQTRATREALATLFPEAGTHAQQLVRLGYGVGRDGVRTARRPLADVLSHRKADGPTGLA